MGCFRSLRNALLPILLCLPSIALPQPTYSLKSILDMPTAPEGVVIEIVTSDNNGLSWALPHAQAYIKRLRQRFAQLPIAIVTHGREQFALTRNNQAGQSKSHQIVQSLQKDSDVQVHVCGTYASWRGLSKEDFPEYVDVAAAGPAQINDYVALGYLRLVIRRQNTAS